MGKYLMFRLLAAIPVLFGVLLIVFVLLRLIPGDPVDIIFSGRGGGASSARTTPEAVEALRASYNLDRSIPVQFLLYVKDVVTGDFGRSFRTNIQVGDLIKELFPQTLQLTLAGMGVALFVGIIAGVVSAIRHHTWVDYTGQFIAVFGVSIPDFFFGLVMIFIFSIWAGWLPAISGTKPIGLVMPAITLGVSSAAILARLTRSSMLDIMSQDFVRSLPEAGFALSRRVGNNSIFHLDVSLILLPFTVPPPSRSTIADT